MGRKRHKNSEQSYKEDGGNRKNGEKTINNQTSMNAMKRTKSRTPTREKPKIKEKRKKPPRGPQEKKAEKEEPENKLTAGKKNIRGH